MSPTADARSPGFGEVTSPGRLVIRRDLSLLPGAAIPPARHMRIR